MFENNSYCIAPLSLPSSRYTYINIARFVKYIQLYVLRFFTRYLRNNIIITHKCISNLK